MVTTENINKVRETSCNRSKANKVIGFVPTMGALHKGHISLIRKAKKECDFLVVSIFINPIQFNLKQDYKCYPRNFTNDKKLLEKEGVDLLFLPKEETMYPFGSSTYAYEDNLSEALCGRLRPGHFEGVCTVLIKLFNIVSPNIAYFGQKDY